MLVGFIKVAGFIWCVVFATYISLFCIIVFVHRRSKGKELKD